MKRRLAEIILLVSATIISARVVDITGDERYSLTFFQAYQKCVERGASLATIEDLHDIARSGKDHCACGWIADRTARYPMNSTDPACGGRPGVHKCNWGDRYDAYCFEGKYTRCNRPLGMESGQIDDKQLSASSAHHQFPFGRWEPHLARLNRKGLINGWMSHHDDTEQYLQIKLNTPHAITGIMTQGVRRFLKNQYVEIYKIRFSKDGDNWFDQYEGSIIKVYKGNTDDDTVVRNMFSTPIRAKYIRIHPLSWSGHISLRVELLGCTLEELDEAQNSKLETSVFSLNDI